MRLKKKITILVLMVVVLSVLVVGFNYESIAKNTKIKKVESLYKEFTKAPDKQGEILVSLSELKKDTDNDISQKASEYYKTILQNSNDKSVIDDTKSKINTIDNKYKKFYVEDLQKVKSDSLYYDEAQELIKELSLVSEEEKEVISIEYYTKHSTAELKKLNITLKNTSGKNINYLALDILEIDKSGEVINSDWTNTSALILNDASISLDTYFDYQGSESYLEFRIKDIRYE